MKIRIPSFGADITVVVNHSGKSPVVSVATDAGELSAVFTLAFGPNIGRGVPEESKDGLFVGATVAMLLTAITGKDMAHTGDEAELAFNNATRTLGNQETK